MEGEHGQWEAEKILETGLLHIGIRRDELGQLKKGDPRKTAIAAVMQKRTSVPIAWIARELHLGHVSRVSHCIRKANLADLTQTLEAQLGK